MTSIKIKCSGNPPAPAGGFRELRAFMPDGKPLTVHPGCRLVVPTGIQVELPETHAAFIYPLAGPSIYNGITIINTPSVIPPRYHKEVTVVLVNHGLQAFTVRHGDLLAMMEVRRVRKFTWKVVTSLRDPR